MSLIGVPINLAKSVTASDKAVVEFVKRVSVLGTEVTPLAWKQFLSQDTFLGRINTVIGLFLKEKSFRDNSISVFQTVLKEKLFDTRPFKDVLAIVSLYCTYAFKTGMSLKFLQRALYLGGPKVVDNSLVFESFDFNQMLSYIQRMVMTGEPAVSSVFYRNSELISEKCIEIFCAQLHRIRNTYLPKEITEAHNKIFDILLGDLPEGDLRSALLFELDMFFKQVQDPVLEYP